MRAPESTSRPAPDWRIAVAALSLALTACGGGVARAPAGPAPDVIDTPAEVIQQVARAHLDAPATAVFTQVNTVTLSSGSVTQRQRVIVSAPGAMRVDQHPLTSRSGVTYVGRRAIGFANGRRNSAFDAIDPIRLLGFDIYLQSADSSLAALEALGIPLAVMHQATYEGMPVWVIGAASGDTTSNQVWIDATRWIPLRHIDARSRAGRTMVSDTRFSGHADPTPTVPRVIEVHREGRRVFRGEVQELRTGIPVPATAFDTVTFRVVEM